MLKSSSSTFITMLLILLLPSLTQSYVNSVTIDTTSSKTIKYFNTDLGSCACDISTACDTFCCCDTKCATNLTTKWTNSGWCVDSATQIEKMCDKIGSKGFSTFEDLGCVMFTNRGAIGQYYATPNINNIVDPNIRKFSTFNINAQGIGSYTLPTSRTYQQNSALKITINGIQKQLLTWVPAMGQACRQNYVPITEGVTTSTCIYPITDEQTCLNLNRPYTGGSFLFCQDGTCATTTNPTNSPSSVTSSDYTGGVCSNAVTGIDISVTISYTSGQYKIVSGTLAFSTSPSISGKKAMVTTKISITKVGTQSSGNPGYLLGKPLKYSTTPIYQIANSADKSCLSSSTTNTLDIRFGVNQTFFCLTTNPCQTALYIDKISLGTSYKLLKYATKSTEEITVTGLTGNTCSTEQFTIYILYSYSGWVLDPQYYILGSKIVKETSANQDVKMKKLNVKWVRVQPSQVFTPPTNYFYTYFSKLWEPLQNSFYKYTGNA